MIETSNCLKAPTVGYQLAGCKRLQQAFSRPGVLSKYLNAAEADILAKYFNESHNFEGENKAQIIDKILADPVEWLLKPQREGGGNIIEGENMCKILREDKELKGLIAMKKIWPVESSTVFSKNGVIFGARSVSEVGVFGTFLRHFNIFVFSLPKMARRC
ncbi:hypothetical protein MHBO_000143 [Bonamia ostreae]|uniref:Glutathione synthetase n=1 Tax=Bonamia ostreae TaxID=126728 RepID=A0ABV2AFU9_9EUKA